MFWLKHSHRYKGAPFWIKFILKFAPTPLNPFGLLHVFGLVAKWVFLQTHSWSMQESSKFCQGSLIIPFIPGSIGLRRRTDVDRREHRRHSHEAFPEHCQRASAEEVIAMINSFLVHFGWKTQRKQKTRCYGNFLSSSNALCFAFFRPILYSNWLSKDYVPVDQEELRDFTKARLKVRVVRPFSRTAVKANFYVVFTIISLFICSGLWISSEWWYFFHSDV